MNYQDFIKNKTHKIKNLGFDVKDSELNKNLFDFQKHIVKTALKKGRYGIFAECGLGKTIMQLEFAYQVAKKTNGNSLILTPLAVSEQTKREANKFNIPLDNITVINYESLHKIDTDKYNCVVLDESSILKNFTGKYKNLIIDTFQNTDYKLSCTATPSPNDIEEINNQSEFLGIMNANQVRAMYFVRNNLDNNYRLKKHSIQDFFNWIGSWSTVLRSPNDIGFNGEDYVLPPLNIIEKTIQVENKEEDQLFSKKSVNATDFNKELKVTLLPRMENVAEIVNNSQENFIIWVNQNEEEKKILELIPDAVSVNGSEKTEVKQQKLLDFANDKFRVLVTKKKIAQYGMNFQNCRNQIFATLDFSFESLYQSIRRSYRFGQKNEVNIYIITTDTMDNVKNIIYSKQKKHNENMERISKAINKGVKMKSDYEYKKTEVGDATLYQGDSVEVIDEIKDNSIDLSIFSPPFSNLFIYSDNVRDMGNNPDNDSFFQQNEYLLQKLYKKIKPGRLVCVHSKDLAVYKGSSGYSGMYDFTGDYHRAMERAGFKYHSKIVIWTDPVLEMQRTKTQRLLYKQLRKDSSYTGIGMPEYVTIFKKWEGDEAEWTPITNKNKENFDLNTWQKWASPVWMDIKRTDVLNGYKDATDTKDEKHIAPLQLEVIKRLVVLYSNKGEIVFTPFLGIGSEVYQSVKMQRKGIGIELKPSYYATAIKNLKLLSEQKKQLSIL